MSVTGRVPGRVDADRAAALLASEGVSKVMLFGSVARGEATEHSDIDLIAIFNDIDYRHRDVKRRELSVRAKAAVGYEVDVVVTDWPEWKARSENLLTSLEIEWRQTGWCSSTKVSER